MDESLMPEWICHLCLFDPKPPEDANKLLTIINGNLTCSEHQGYEASPQSRVDMLRTRKTDG
jgi:hypothetical protein